MQNAFWEEGTFDHETEGMSFLDKADFLTKKAVESTGALKEGVWVSTKDLFSDVWIEVIDAFGNFFKAPECYDTQHRIQRIANISHVATSIKQLEYPYRPRIVFTKKGKFGGKNGIPLDEFFNNPDYE